MTFLFLSASQPERDAAMPGGIKQLVVFNKSIICFFIESKSKLSCWINNISAIFPSEMQQSTSKYKYLSQVQVPQNEKKVQHLSKCT